MICHEFRDAGGSSQQSPGSVVADWGHRRWLYFVGFNNALLIGTFPQLDSEQTLPGVPRRDAEEPSEVAGELLGCPQGTIVGRKGDRVGPWEDSEGQ